MWGWGSFYLLTPHFDLHYKYQSYYLNKALVVKTVNARGFIQKISVIHLLIMLIHSGPSQSVMVKMSMIFLK